MVITDVGAYVAQTLVKQLAPRGVALRDGRVGVLGVIALVPAVPPRLEYGRL